MKRASLWFTVYLMILIFIGLSVRLNIAGTGAVRITVNADTINGIEATNQVTDLKDKIAPSNIFPICRVFLNGNLLANTTTLTTISYNAKTYDSYNSFDTTTTYRFTAPTTGYYLIESSNRILNLDDGKYVEAFIYKDGVVYTKCRNVNGILGNLDILLSDMVYISKDDYIEMKIRHNHGTSRNLEGTSEGNYMSVFLLRTD